MVPLLVKSADKVREASLFKVREAELLIVISFKTTFPLEPSSSLITG